MIDLVNHPIVGVWELVVMTLTAEDESIIHPFGEVSIGRIIYTPEGYMMTTLARRDRPHWVIPDPLGGTKSEKSAAVETYSTYSGQYTLENEKVYHHIDLSIFPNWVGESEMRYFEIVDDRLTLTTEPFQIAGQRNVGQAIWRRVAIAA